MHATTLLVSFASGMMGAGDCSHAIRPILLQCYCTCLRCVEFIVTVLVLRTSDCIMGARVVHV